MSDFDTDPAALAWARERVQHHVDRYRRFEAERIAAGEDPQPWRGLANFMQRDLIGGEGCVIASFDERLPQFRAATASAKTVVTWKNRPEAVAE